MQLDLNSPVCLQGVVPNHRDYFTPIVLQAHSMIPYSGTADMQIRSGVSHCPENGDATSPNHQ
jgi:hypothetical protein